MVWTYFQATLEGMSFLFVPFAASFTQQTLVGGSGTTISPADAAVYRNDPQLCSQGWHHTEVVGALEWAISARGQSS